MRRLNQFLTVLRPCVLVIAAAWLSSEAMGQNVQFFGGGDRFGASAEPPVDSRMVRRYGRMLGFDEMQSEAAQALLEGMLSEWESQAKKVREEMESIREEFQESRDVSIWTDRVPGIMRKAGETRGRLEKGFMDDFKSLLTDDQTANWGAVERTYRRESTIGTGRLSGESVDLVRVTEDLGLAEATLESVRGVLGQYEADLDRALVERNSLVQQAMSRVGNGPGGIEQAMQDEEFVKLREKARQARLLVRDTNQRYARQVASALPQAEAEKFNAEFTRRSFEEVFRRSLTSESIEAAAGFDDLSPDQRQMIADMRSSYEPEVERANKVLMSAIEKYESTEEGYLSSLGGGMRFMFNRGGGDEETPNPVEEARRSKRELERTTLDKLKSLLNDGQRDRLPKRRERGGPRAAGFGGGDGPGVMVVQGGGEGGDEELESGEGQAIHVIREVTIGPDGKPIEQQAVFVQRVAPGEEPADGEDEVFEYVEEHEVTDDKKPE